MAKLDEGRNRFRRTKIRHGCSEYMEHDHVERSESAQVIEEREAYAIGLHYKAILFPSLAWHNCAVYRWIEPHIYEL